MAERDWMRDWELAIDHGVPDTEKYDKLQLALRHWLYEYKKVQENRNLEKKMRKDAEDRAAKLEERARELEEENRNLKTRIGQLEQLICDFQAAAMLGEDPDGITPTDVEREIMSLRQRIHELEGQLNEERLLHQRQEQSAADYIKKLKERIRELEAQLNLQNQGLPVTVVEVEGEYDYTRKLEAQCVALQKAIEDYCLNTCYGYDEPECKTGAGCGYFRGVLSTTAGRELLERVKKLEDVAEAAREYTKNCACDHGCHVYQRTDYCPGKRLDEALAALDKEGANHEI